MLSIILAAALLSSPSACEAPSPPLAHHSNGHVPDGRVRPSARRRRTKARSQISVARCVRLQILERREALLHDFLVRVQTEQPQFTDPRSYRLAIGASIGPVAVTRDFVGSPIIRARVTNLGAADLSFLLSATLASAGGVQTGATEVVLLHAHETRTVELLCPDDVAPQSLTWSTMPL